MKKRLLFVLMFFALFIIPINTKAATKTILGNEYQTKNFIETIEEENINKAFSSYSEGNNKITIYMFRGKGCSFCQAFLNFMNGITQEYGKYFNMVSFEVWYDENNWNLLNQTSYYMDKELFQSVPYIIIGDKVFHGYSNTYDEDIKNAIVNLYNTAKNDRYDVFKEAEKNGFTSMEELKKLFPEDNSGDTTSTEEKNATSSSSTSDKSVILWNLLFVAVGTGIVIFFTNYRINKLEEKLTKKTNDDFKKPEKKKK